MGTAGKSWVVGAGNASVEGVLALRPDLAEHVIAFDDFARASIGARLRSLLEIRGAQLLRDGQTLAVSDPELVAQATSWHNHPALSDDERLALEICETFLMDHHSMTDDQIARLQQQFGEQGAVAVLMNIGMIDGFTKFRRVFSEEAI